MNIKSLKVVLMTLALNLTSLSLLAEEMPESSKAKADRIEREVNELYQRGFRTASVKMDKTNQVIPFAVILKKDGKYGVFSTQVKEQEENITVDEQAASIRKHLIELVVADQINAAMQVMYAAVKEEGKPARQGLIFEIEHAEGVSLLRFLPVSKIKDSQGAETDKLLFEMESLSTSAKPQVVFAYAKAK